MDLLYELELIRVGQKPEIWKVEIWKVQSSVRAPRDHRVSHCFNEISEISISRLDRQYRIMLTIKAQKASVNGLGHLECMDHDGARGNMSTVWTRCSAREPFVNFFHACMTTWQ
jgi:hypothetical protein